VSLAQRSALRIIEESPRIINWEGLVQAIAAGEERAASRFYEATSGLLFGLLLLILNDMATAERILLEIYDEVRQRAARFDRNHEDLLTWLITITHRRALEQLLSSKEDQQFAVSVGLARPPGPGEVHRFGISKSAHRRLVWATLDALSPAERKMIELAYFSRLTPPAIGQKLRQPPENVKAGLQRGISQLYNLFKRQGFLVAASGQRGRSAETR
jgi:RNA polymerase sigma-70 factor (ECF subfamily)